jgi:hypothetical protein
MFKVLMFLVFLSSGFALGITTDEQGNVTLDDGMVIAHDDPMIITDSEVDFDNNVFCDIGVLAFAGGVFQNLQGAQRFCGQFDRFCHSRQFGNAFHEGRFRQRQIFRGRGNSRFNARGNAWNLYLNFLNGNNGRNGRFQNRFGHQFGFSSNCG